MRDVKDFNNINHRVASASAAFQKGIYHLFLLKTREVPDMYARVLRMYQCLFQLCLTQLLLDLDYKLNERHFQGGSLTPTGERFWNSLSPNSEVPAKPKPLP